MKPINFDVQIKSLPIQAGCRTWKILLAILGFDFDDILERARQMDINALAEIHDRYYPEIYRYVRYRQPNEQICEDITSEVILRLLDALHKQRGPTRNLKGWLLGTASNLVNDHLRRHYSRTVEELDDNVDQINQEDSPEDWTEDDDEYDHDETSRPEETERPTRTPEPTDDQVRVSVVSSSFPGDSFTRNHLQG